MIEGKNAEAAEVAVLGAAILSATAHAEVVDRLHGGMFTRSSHRLVFDTLVKLADDGAKADTVTLSEALSIEDRLDELGGPAALHDLVSACPSPSQAGHYCGIVEQAWRRRQVIEGARQIAVAAQAGDEKLDDLIDATVESWTSSGSDDGVVKVEDLRAAVRRRFEGGEMVPSWLSGWSHVDKVFRLPRGLLTVVTGIPGSGKALALGTPIPTPTGWTTMEDLRVGDQVLDDQGKPCTVTAATEVMHDRTCYRVAFGDGGTLIADADHQWLTSDRAARMSAANAAKRTSPVKPHGTDQSHKRTYPKVRTTAEIAATLKVEQGKRNNHAVPVARPLDLPEADLLVHPYVLGVWLGDGTSSGASVSIGGRDLELVEHIRSCGMRVVLHERGDNYLATVGAVRGSGRCSRNHEITPGVKCVPCGNLSSAAWRKGEPVPPRPNRPLTEKLRELGVLNNKHVPTAYLRGSFDQRLALLQGLMDTDGTINAAGNCCFTSTSHSLADAVRELALTLGVRARIRYGQARLNGRVIGPKWEVAFTTTLPVFRLTRKLKRLPTGLRATSGWNPIIGCDPVESEPVRCIQVDSPSHLFLAGREMIPTHNSTWVDCLLWNVLKNHQDVKVAMFSPEQSPADKHATNLVHTALGTDPMAADWSTVERGLSWIDRRVTWLDDQRDNTVSGILARARLIKRRAGLDVLVVDPWNKVRHDRGRHARDDLYIQEALGRFSRFARKEGVAVMLVAHPKVMEAEPGSKTRIKAPTAYSISGGSEWDNQADVIVAVHRDKHGERQAPEIVQLIVQKVRDEGRYGQVGAVELWFDGRARRYSAVPLEQRSAA